METITNKDDAMAASCLSINATSVLLGLSLVNKAKLHLKKPLKEAKLTMNQWLILKIIYLRRADNPSTVAKAIDADPTTITRHLDSLVKRELIERKHNEDDRRKIELNITPKGTAVSKSIYKSYSGILQNFENYLRDDEIIIWKKIEQCICEHVQDNID